MITVAILNIIVVFFAYLARYKQTEFCLKVSFCLIFLFLALRCDYGNDYQNNLNYFLKANLSDLLYYSDKPFRFELGWMFLCCLFKPLGFISMVAVLALFNCIVYYRFIKKYVPPAYYWFAVFLYVFDPDLMLIESSAMQQTIAINLFLISIDYLYKKAAIRYFLCIGLASLFHTGALLLLPVYLLGLFNWKINKLTAGSIFSFYFFLLLYGKIFEPKLNLFISTYFVQYEKYENIGSGIGSGVGMVFYSCMLILVLLYERLEIKETAILSKMVILSYFLVPLGFLIPMLARVEMFFHPAVLVVFPTILLNTKNPVFKNIILALIMLSTMYLFYRFFHHEVWREAFSTYKTIFSSPKIYSY